MSSNNNIKLILTTSENEPEEIKVPHGSHILKKASFFIGEADARPTKILGPDDEEIQMEDILVAPDGGWGWMIVLASFLSNMIVDGIVFSFGILLTPIHEASNKTISISSIAWVGSLATGFYFLAGPVVSAVANRFGFRVVAIFGSLIASLAIFISWYLCRDGPVMWVLFVFYGVIGGVGFGMIYVPAVIAVGFYFEKKRALATGIAICGSGIGTFLFPPIMNKIIENYNWQGALFFQAIIILSCILFGLLYRPLKPTKKPKGKYNEQDRRKSLASSLGSPEGTPLLIRIKRARELEKWDSVNSFNSTEAFHEGPEIDPKTKAERLYHRNVRKTSTHSLGGNVAGLTVQPKRMSVPSMLATGDSASTVQQQQQGANLVSIQIPSKGKSFILPDLKEIAEEDHSEEGSRENSQPPEPNAEPVMKEQLIGNDNTSSMRNRNSTFITKIGNSTLTVDEMTQSRILRVASKAALNKPMYRDDIFYSGSLLRIPQYANVSNRMMTSVEWTAAISTAPVGLEQEPEVLRKMLDTSLLVSPMFLLLSMSGFFTMLGLFVPFIYIKNVAMDYVDASTATLLISIIGVANTVGRIVSGWAADRPEVNVLLLNNVSLTIIGLSTAIVPFLVSYIQFIVFAIVFGLSMACFTSLRSILVVELLGLDKLTNAFGLMLVFQGFASMVGTPLAGLLYEGTNSYKSSFIVAGVFLVLSGLMCYPLNVVKNWEEKRNKLKQKVLMANP